MTKHGHKTLFIILAAMLCLFLASGVIFGKMFSPPDLPVKTIEAGIVVEAAGEAGTDEAGFADQAGVVAGAAGEAGADEAVISAEAETAPNDDRASVKSAEPMLSCRHFNEKEFLKSVNETASVTANSTNEADTPNGATKGGILPHHLLAGKMIASFFSTLAQDPPGTIVVIGPNHKLVGASKIHTSTADWGTAFGTLEADRQIAGELIEKMGASENNTLMEDEHSISGLVPYIKYYMSDTKVVPILLHGSYTKKQSKELGELLAEIISERPDTVILASTDFSHYLDVMEADKKDEITLAAITSWNIDELNRMSNDNLDSVPCVTALLHAMDTLGAKDIKVTGHSNSSRITRSGYDYTTSYFTMFFRLKD